MLGCGLLLLVVRLRWLPRVAGTGQSPGAGRWAPAHTKGSSCKPRHTGQSRPRAEAEQSTGMGRGEGAQQNGPSQQSRAAQAGPSVRPPPRRAILAIRSPPVLPAASVPRPWLRASRVLVKRQRHKPRLPPAKAGRAARVVWGGPPSSRSVLSLAQQADPAAAEARPNSSSRQQRTNPQHLARPGRSIGTKREARLTDPGMWSTRDGLQQMGQLTREGGARAGLPEARPAAARTEASPGPPPGGPVNPTPHGPSGPGRRPRVAAPVRMVAPGRPPAPRLARGAGRNDLWGAKPPQAGLGSVGATRCPS